MSQPDWVKCICDTGPNSDGPEMECPIDGALQFKPYHNETQETYEFRMELQNINQQFDNDCREIHSEQSQPIEFLGEDVITKMMHALAEAAVAARWQYTKLALLQNMLLTEPRLAKLADENGDVSIGWPKGHTDGGTGWT